MVLSNTLDLHFDASSFHAQSALLAFGRHVRLRAWPYYPVRNFLQESCTLLVLPAALGHGWIHFESEEGPVPLLVQVAVVEYFNGGGTDLRLDVPILLRVQGLLLAVDDERLSHDQRHDGVCLR